MSTYWLCPCVLVLKVVIWYCMGDTVCTLLPSNNQPLLYLVGYQATWYQVLVSDIHIFGVLEFPDPDFCPVLYYNT